MLRKRYDNSRGGRKPNLQCYPAALLLGNRQEEIRLLAEIYGMTLEQAREHRRLYGLGALYVTHNAKEKCEYQVIVKSGKDVPQQGEIGARVIQIAVKRMDNKTDPFPWSDLQEIKRAILGDEIEAIEIFPAMSRRLRGEDKWRYLWAFPDGEKLAVGWDFKDQVDPINGEQDDETGNKETA